jgi:hypothetical protein
MSRLPDVLFPPNKPHHLNANAKWLAGEGAGSWFSLEFVGENIEVKRYSNVGDLECTNRYKKVSGLNLDEAYEITFPSHCAKVSLSQNEQLFILDVGV